MAELSQVPAWADGLTPAASKAKAKIFLEWVMAWAFQFCCPGLSNRHASS
jgi:hypothetical protein